MLRIMLTFGFSWNCIHCFVCSTFRMVFNFSHISLMKVQCCTYLIISSSNRPQSFCWGTRQSITGALAPWSEECTPNYTSLLIGVLKIIWSRRMLIRQSEGLSEMGVSVFIYLVGTVLVEIFSPHIAFLALFHDIFVSEYYQF